jgi:hypothetical protein
LLWHYDGRGTPRPYLRPAEFAIRQDEEKNVTTQVPFMTFTLKKYHEDTKNTKFSQREFLLLCDLQRNMLPE